MAKQSKNHPAMSRRRLLGLGLIGAGASSGIACKSKWTPAQSDPFGRSMHKPPVPGAEAWARGEERFAVTTCGQCPAGCGIRVRVVEGRAVRIDGNANNPLNQGGVGPRGLSGLQVLYDPDRLTGPMVRKEGVLTPTSWDEALAVVADGLSELRTSGEPHRLLVMSGRERGLMNELWQRFCTAFGTPNFVDGRPSRSAAIAQAMAEATGSYEVPAYDWAGARYVLSLEAGLVEDSCQAVYFSRVASRVTEHGPSVRPVLVHAAGAFDLAAHSADEWLRITPGSSGALALGLCRQLLAQGTYHHVLAETQPEALEALRAAVEPYSLAHTRELTGMSEKNIARLADELWQSRPSFAVIDDRSVSFANGLATARAALALNCLLGAMEAERGGVRMAPDLPYRPWPELLPDPIALAGLTQPRMDGAATAFPSARSVHATLPKTLVDARCALLYYTNPVFARAQPSVWRKALAEVPLVVSFSPVLDETTAEVAHVVLPDHTYLERHEDGAGAPGLPRAVVGIRQPVVHPLHDTRSTGDVVLALARAIGSPMVEAMPWPSWPKALDHRLLGLMDTRRGSVRADSERAFLDQLRTEGVWVDSAPPSPRPVKLPGTIGWTAPSWHGDAEAFPLRLVVYRPLGHAVGSGANQPWLHTLRSRPGERAWTTFASIHPDSAPGLTTGDTITLESALGAISLPVRLDQRMEVGYVAVPLGSGHTAMGRFARGLGANPMTVVSAEPAPASGANVLSHTRVRLRKGGSHD